MASRKRNRYTLEFMLPDDKSKKFYLCEFCKQKSKKLVWIYYRNYVAQHIPRHHPDQCEKCPGCRRPIVLDELAKHMRTCQSQIKADKATHGEFTILEGPQVGSDQRQHCTSPVAKELADMLEVELKSNGFGIAAGFCGQPAIGYPIDFAITSKLDVLLSMVTSISNDQESIEGRNRLLQLHDVSCEEYTLPSSIALKPESANATTLPPPSDDDAVPSLVQCEVTRSISVDTVSTTTPNCPSAPPNYTATLSPLRDFKNDKPVRRDDAGVAQVSGR